MGKAIAGRTTPTWRPQTGRVPPTAHAGGGGTAPPVSDRPVACPPGVQQHQAPHSSPFQNLGTFCRSLSALRAPATGPAPAPGTGLGARGSPGRPAWRRHPREASAQGGRCAVCGRPVAPGGEQMHAAGPQEARGPPPPACDPRTGRPGSRHAESDPPPGPAPASTLVSWRPFWGSRKKEAERAHQGRRGERRGLTTAVDSSRTGVFQPQLHFAHQGQGPAGGKSNRLTEELKRITF